MTEANNDFYTRIPHDFGMKVPPIINTMAEVRLKVKLLELLDDIEVAIKALAQKSDLTNPIDRNYEQLECELKPLSRDSDTFKLIDEYIKNTHGQTHNNYSLKLIDVFEAERPGEVERFVDHGNRMLLWHGSRVTNWAGILSQGLRIAPPEAPVTGYMVIIKKYMIFKIKIPRTKYIFK
jgi:poly [ADP-ribose] polymerase